MHDLESAGNAKKSDGFFEKGILKALESEHITNTIQEVKVIGNGHCHGMSSFLSSLILADTRFHEVTENCRRVKGVWLCFGGGGSYSGYGKLG